LNRECERIPLTRVEGLYIAETSLLMDRFLRLNTTEGARNSTVGLFSGQTSLSRVLKKDHQAVSQSGHELEA
jgi:hypothetical protein